MKYRVREREILHFLAHPQNGHGSHSWARRTSLGFPCGEQVPKNLGCPPMLFQAVSEELIRSGASGIRMALTWDAGMGYISSTHCTTQPPLHVWFMVTCRVGVQPLPLTFAQYLRGEVSMCSRHRCWVSRLPSSLGYQAKVQCAYSSACGVK